VAFVQRGASAFPIEGFADVGAVLRAGERGFEAAENAVGGDPEPLVVGDDAVLRPVLDPGSVICVGLNYRRHIEEMGREMPEQPTLFSKPSRSLTDPFAPIPMPRASTRLDYEGEMAVVIGAPGRDVAAENAWDHVAGLAVFNDISVRDFQARTSQWFAGKAWEGSSPWGPAVVTFDSRPDFDSMDLCVTVNGEERQRACVADLVFGLEELIEDVSRIFTLQPGDLIATGTPGGVGMADGRYLQPGDLVEVEVDGLGKISNRVI
jgi:acylpyruvate hydrolase